MTFIKSGNLLIMPVHMNVIFASEYFLLNSNLDDRKFSSIVNEINEQDVYILDFSGVRDTLTSKSIMAGAEGIKGKKVLMINLINSIYEGFQNCLEEDVVKYENNQWGLCLKTKQFDYKELPDLSDFHYLYTDLEGRCRNHIPEGNKLKLIGSNVYMNKFFDLRKFYGDMDTVKIVVYLMTLKIKKWEKDTMTHGFSLVSSSFNGCILANLLALIIGRKHISIPHLGPETTEEDNRYIDSIKKGDKLVYIYDFIALGNEQKTISTIAKSLGAKIVHSFGLTYFKPTKSEENATDCLVESDKVMGKVYVAASEEDIITLTGEKNA